MFKKLAFVACLAVLAGCSDSGGSSGDDNNNAAETPVAETPVAQPPVETPVVETPVAQPPVETGGGSANPSGGLSGAWFGNTGFGEGVVVIDNTNRIFGLSNAGDQYQAVTGNVGEALEPFRHRTSDNPASATSFTLVGDPEDPFNYNLSVVNDGQQLNNTGGPGDFALTFATTNDIAAIDAAAVNGSWQALTSFCPMDCDIALTLTFNGTTVGGSTLFAPFDPIPINGTIAAAPDSNLYMTIGFEWNGQNRSGVIYRDRTDSNRLILNTVGVDGENGNRTFTAILSRI